MTTARSKPKARNAIKKLETLGTAIPSTMPQLPDAMVSVAVSVKQNFDGLCLLQNMISLGEGEESGSVATGAGLGSDAIGMEWKGRRALVLGRDLFKAWISTWAPEDAARIP